ncbi:MAG TPA: SDR family oxidoreductase [Baekduia sp.]|uniref:SDR family oxidoreductase n=1 Tax=Baekduia sp. TaxID=2600305 RepID=UPI002D77DA6C|nr:SDR family oxidoreductase [Baekduia sp.]HET6509119.1 SDR family oxidoreductase [Baekduia sp.]
MAVLVCGGSRGIGRAIAAGLAEPGGTVFINYAGSGDEAETAAADVRARGATAVLVAGDIATPAGAATVIERVRAVTDRIDTLVHCAVTTVSGPVLEADPRAFLRAVEVNAMSLLYVVQAALPLIGEGSSIVFLSSRGSRVALKDYASVGAPKAFAEGLVRYMAVELAARGARANCVSPTAQDTDAFRAVFPEDHEERLAAAARNSPSGRAVGLDDIVGTVRFLASPAASMVQGQVLVLDGASTLAA